MKDVYLYKRKDKQAAYDNLTARYTPFRRWSWLDDLALRAGSTSARRALVEQLRERLQYYTIQMTR